MTKDQAEKVAPLLRRLYTRVSFDTRSDEDQTILLSVTGPGGLYQIDLEDWQVGTMLHLAGDNIRVLSAEASQLAEDIGV